MFFHSKISKGDWVCVGWLKQKKYYFGRVTDTNVEEDSLLAHFLIYKADGRYFLQAEPEAFEKNQIIQINFEQLHIAKKIYRVEYDEKQMTKAWNEWKAKFS